MSVNSRPLLQSDVSARTELGSALRQLVDVVMEAPPDREESQRVTDTITPLIASLQGGRKAGTQDDGAPQSLAEASQRFFEINPISGPLNPIAPPAAIRVVDIGEDDRPEVRADVIFGAAYEGPRDHVHGGMVAAVLDSCLGTVNNVAGVAGVTVDLTVRYRRPTPLHQALTVEARVIGVDGRKVFSWAGIYHGDTLTAEANATFLTLRSEATTEQTNRLPLPAAGPKATADSDC